jgi:hypothetical protein
MLYVPIHATARRKTMEVKETAACGISLREFAIELEQDEIVDMYRVFNYAQNESGFFDEDFLDELKSQMTYIIGPSLEEEPAEDIEETIHWEDTGAAYSLAFTEPEGGKLYQILNGAENPDDDFDRKMNQKLMDQMMEIAPTALENMTVINR